MSKPTIQQRVSKEFPEFCEEVASLSAEQVDARLAQLAKDVEGVQEAKDADESLQSARETAKQLAAPYREAKTAIALKSSYLVALLKDRGAS